MAFEKMLVRSFERIFEQLRHGQSTETVGLPAAFWRLKTIFNKYLLNMFVFSHKREIVLDKRIEEPNYQFLTSAVIFRSKKFCASNKIAEILCFCKCIQP